MSFLPGPGPASVWIELTSKCPLRCVFCSRENLRGDGEHMSMAMLESILHSLDRPEVIRLNYSGESANYPWLVEAIGITKAVTHTQVEIVTSLVSMPQETIRGLAVSGIDRISISLHSLNQKTFPQIYGGGSLDSFQRRLQSLLQAVRETTRPPAIDFAMVAMSSNAAELPAIAALASEHGASLLSIHPVIRRPGVPALFETEASEDGALTGAFQTELDSNVEAARQTNPGLRISVARPPAFVAQTAPFTCEQNPFDTVHVLSNGDIVACEVMDRTPLGNLRSSTLLEIWHGPAYQELRHRYMNRAIPECAACVFRAPVAELGPLRTCWGWHPRDQDGNLWSRTACSFECEPNGHRLLVLTGLLPDDPQYNIVEFLREGQQIALVRNQSGESLPFRVELELDSSLPVNRFTARVEYGFSPWRRGVSGDVRELGFALFSAELSDAGPSDPTPTGTTRPASRLIPRLRRKAADSLIAGLGLMQNLASHQRNSRTFHSRVLPDDSLGVIVPERGGAAILAVCLASLQTALAKVSIDAEVVVVVNGSPGADYAGLMAAHPGFRFIFVAQPLGFNAAIRQGLRHISAGWAYLLNNDVRLAEDTLARLLPHRAAAVFSLASRIRMTSEQSALETNRTGIEFIDGLANLVELDGATNGPVEHFYSGGGSSLFQTAWLRRFAGRTACYDPFYWEDAEWGVLARAAGLRNIFVPDSAVQHVGQATIGRFYKPEEVARIFERNRIQFQLRCTPARDTSAIRDRLEHAPLQTICELLQPLRLVSMARTRAALNGYS